MVQRSIMVAGAAALVAGVGLVLPTVLSVVWLSGSTDAALVVPWMIVMVARAAPWLMGAWLVRSAPRLGVAVLITSAVLSVLDVARTLDGFATGMILWDGWEVAVTLLTWAAMSTAAVAAWVGRPRGGWQARGEVSVWLVVPIVLASVPLVVPEAMIVGRDGVPVGGWFVTNLDLARGAGDVIALVLLPVVVLVTTVVLLRLRRRVAAGILLAAAGPTLVLQVTNVVQVTRTVDSQVMPGGVAALVGNALLVVLAAWWLTRDDEKLLRSRGAERPLPIT